MKQIHENLAIPLTDIRDKRGANGLPSLSQVAIDLHNRFSYSANADLARDFPGSLEAYTASVEAIEDRLRARRHKMWTHADEYAMHIPLIYSEGASWALEGRLRAVGVGALTVAGKASPELPDNPNIDLQSPNLSLIICRPHRGVGIGKLLMGSLIEAVERDFDGRAWTSVRVDNTLSQALVAGFGFQEVGRGQFNGEPVIQYDFQSHHNNAA
jgi:GNAT superfamily N-acetyltransferase